MMLASSLAFKPFGRIPLAVVSSGARSSSSSRRGPLYGSAFPPSSSLLATSALHSHPAGCCFPQHRAMAVGLKLQPAGDPVFAIDTNSIRFGRGALLELGAAVASKLQPTQSNGMKLCNSAPVL